MGEYRQTSINLRPDQLEYLQTRSINTSDLLRTLVDGYVNGGEDPNVGLEHRRTEIENEIEQLELQLEQKRDELASIEQREEEKSQIESRHEGMYGILQQVHLQFKNYPPSKIGSSQRFTDIAFEHDIGVQELKREYLTYRESMGD